jgi:DNA-directed RNA polymerase subunit RPC12/RpoP
MKRFDFVETAELVQTPAMRCILCGEIIDSEWLKTRMEGQESNYLVCPTCSVMMVLTNPGMKTHFFMIQNTTNV